MLLSNLNGEKYATRFSKVYFPENEDPMIKYEKVLPWTYTAAADGETVIVITSLIGSLRITQIEKEIKPMDGNGVDFSFNSSNGQINLLGGISMMTGEKLFILYSVLVTS